jgi:hypothetical protein
MSELVAECRREWKRLGVPEAVADEMAAELQADLDDAEAEGGSPADVLGRHALDPRAVAASWAIERGVVPRRRFTNGGRRRRLVLAAFVTVATLVMIGASVAILAWESPVAESGLVTSLDGQVVQVDPLPAPVRFDAPGAPVEQEAQTHGIWVMHGVTPPARPDDDLDPVGWLLLAVGLVGLVPAGLLWFSRGGGPAPVAPA